VGIDQKFTKFCATSLFECSLKISTYFFRIRANKVILAYSSGLLRHILSSNCDCAGSFIPITYNILLPDFNPEPVQKILDLIYYGFTSISKDNDMLINEMDSICKTLDITSLPSFKNVISESSLTNYNQLPVPVHSEKVTLNFIQHEALYQI
jgi:hypothetical protein